MTMPKEHLGHHIGPVESIPINEDADMMAVAKRLNQKEMERVDSTSRDQYSE